MLEQLKKIVTETGKNILTWKEEDFEVNHKGDKFDLVTELDIRTQNYLINELNKSFGYIPVFAEEEGLSSKPNSDKYWLIDPIDGTINFSRGLPEYCISLAYIEKDEPVYGIIYSPELNHLYYSEKGKGSFLNNKKLNPCWTDDLEQAMITVGNIRGKSHITVEALEKEVMRIRFFGSAALHIAYTSAGYADAFLSYKAHPWDIAAGHLILKEAGGVILNKEGKEATIFDSVAVYSNPYLAEKLVKFLEIK